MAEGVVSATLPVAVAVRTSADRLRRAGCDSPRLDAELLLGAVLALDRAGLVMAAGRELTSEEGAQFTGLIERRAEHEPVAYILGRRGFRHVELSVDRRVLVPRPETELLVEVGLELADGAAVADVGTGSGAVALALADERRDLVVTGSDVSADALAVARANGRALGLPVRFVEADLLDDGVYDAVLANLPYVADSAVLADDVAGFEPAGALFGGVDGLDVIRRLVAAVAARPVRPELLALEIGPEQVAAVSNLLTQVAGYASVEVRRDLAGLDRVVVGRA